MLTISRRFLKKKVCSLLLIQRIDGGADAQSSSKTQIGTSSKYTANCRRGNATKELRKGDECIPETGVCLGLVVKFYPADEASAKYTMLQMIDRTYWKSLFDQTHTLEWMVSQLGGSFEFEFQKKATRIREQLSRSEVDIRRKVTDIQKGKVEALKKTEEMKYSAQHDLEKISQDVMKAKDLGTDIKTRLTSEIVDLKNEIERKYSELKNTISEKTTE